MISAVVLTKNAEKSIGDCLRSVQFCDEVIVVDDGSTDQTVELAKKNGAVVITRQLNDFAAQRNIGMGQTKNDWILFVDADEVITPELANEIKNLPSSADVWYMRRRDFFWGQELRFGETKKVREKGLIRLVKKGSGNWVGRVHEEFQTSKQVGRLNGFINHYPHPTLKTFLTSINLYSTLRARELLSQKKRATLVTLFLYPFGKFILTYFLKCGFLDGPAGFVYAFFMSFHSFLVRAKLYQYSVYEEK